MGNPIDLGKLQAQLETLQRILGQLQGVAPKHWKGNDAPNVHHFDAESIRFSGGVLIDKQRAWAQFDYTDNGAPHTVRGEFDLGEVGTRGGHDVISVDGQIMGSPDFVLGHRIGWENGFYTRAVLEFRYLDPAGQSHDLRFDGDI